MSSRSRAARLAAAGLAASAIAAAPAGVAGASTPGPPEFPTATRNSITAATPQNPGPPAFPTATTSSATGTSAAQQPGASQTSDSVTALGIVAIAAGALVLGFAAALVLTRGLARRAARA
jgi:hypothetical protein